MLIIPSSGTPFEPKVGYFLGGIEIYDREETLGEEIRRYNPNAPLEREAVIKKYIVPTESWLSYRHKYVFLKVLEEALNNPDYDFSSEFASDYDSDDYTCVAWDESEIENPRRFFEDIYRIVSEVWHEDIERARQEDPSTW